MPFPEQGKKNLDKFFDKSVISQTARASGFVQRKARRISAYHFVLGFILSCLKGQHTFSQWAFEIGLLSGHSVSKQGVFERMGPGAVGFAKALLERFLIAQSGKAFRAELFAAFNNVYLHDSTTLGLPQVLSHIFPGNYSRGQQKAVARIQSVISLKTMRVIELALGAFTQNDQSASGSILQWVQNGDLVIRDMGYFSLAVFEKLIGAEVHFLSRLRYGVSLYDEQGHLISLHKLLQRRKAIDQWVCIGNKKNIRVRLVMLPLPAQQTAERIGKARQDRDKRLNHSNQYYRWLGYGVYITTVQTDVWTAHQVAQAYRVRWQIEIIFKSWKSGFHLQQLLHQGCTNEHRVKISIYLMLLFICLFMQKIYIRCKHELEKQNKHPISLMKLATYACKNMQELISANTKLIKELIIRHCCYDKRHDRTNMTDLCQRIKN